MLSETLEKVKNLWQKQGLAVNDPLDLSRTKKQLQLLGVQATDEILEVFSTLNGFEDIDDECLSFWSLDQMIRENVNSRYIVDKSYVHFADFLIFSHTYAFRQDSEAFGSLYCYYAPDYIVRIADSFEEFFEYYLKRDSGKLWPK